MDRSGREEPKPASWTARILAPLVLVAAVAAIVLVISGSMNASDDSDDAPKQSETSNTGCKPDADQAVEDGYYVISAEDTQGLSGVAQKTCIPLERLVKLNPNLDPQAIQVSNCVDLVADGCRALSSG
jgi:hypothetical protein